MYGKYLSECRVYYQRGLQQKAHRKDSREEDASKPERSSDDEPAPIRSVSEYKSGKSVKAPVTTLAHNEFRVKCMHFEGVVVKFYAVWQVLFHRQGAWAAEPAFCLASDACIVPQCVTSCRVMW